MVDGFPEGGAFVKNGEPEYAPVRRLAMPIYIAGITKVRFEFLGRVYEVWGVGTDAAYEAAYEFIHEWKWVLDPNNLMGA